jgi:NAD-dependent deacetylase
MIREITKENWVEQTSDLLKIVEKSHFITAITGAGISLSCGLPLVQDKYHDMPVRDLFRRQVWADNPEKYFHLYRHILKTWRHAKPSEAHQWMARRGVWTITQNVDGLHRDAGSTHLLEIHGNLRELRCLDCEAIYGAKLLTEVSVPRCPKCHRVLRPGFTFEGEEIRHFSLAMDWCGRAEVLLVVGTELEMQPVKMLPEIARQRGDCLLIVVNYESNLVIPKLLRMRRNGVYEAKEFDKDAEN